MVQRCATVVMYHLGRNSCDWPLRLTTSEQCVGCFEAICPAEGPEPVEYCSLKRHTCVCVCTGLCLYCCIYRIYIYIYIMWMPKGITDLLFFQKLLRQMYAHKIPGTCITSHVTVHALTHATSYARYCSMPVCESLCAFIFAADATISYMPVCISEKMLYVRTKFRSIHWPIHGREKTNGG